MGKNLFPNQMAMMKISASFPHGLDASDSYSNVTQLPSDHLHFWVYKIIGLNVYTDVCNLEWGLLLINKIDA